MSNEKRNAIPQTAVLSVAALQSINAAGSGTPDFAAITKRLNSLPKELRNPVIIDGSGSYKPVIDSDGRAW